MKRLIFTIIIASVTLSSFSQLGGTSTYNFLRLTNSARLAALGNNFAPVKDGDVTLSVANPSIIDENMHNDLALSFVDYYTDISYGFASYSRTFDKLGSFTGSVQYIDYGETMETSAFEGDTLGYFNGLESAVTLGWARPLDSLLYIGANFKMITSSLHTYNSLGVAVDLAATYHNPEKRFTASLIFRNIGRQITYYEAGQNEPLPFEVQLGISKRLQHLPFRYSIVLTDLQKFDLTYVNPNSADNLPDPFTGEIEGEDDKGIADKLMRHVVIGGEFMPTKNFSLRFGYNYRLRQEMKVDSKLGTVGLSWGLGFRVSKFHFSYSRAAYHLVGSPNYVTITTSLSEF